MKYLQSLFIFFLLFFIACNHPRINLADRWMLLEKKGIPTSDRIALQKIQSSLPFLITDFTGDPLSGSFIHLSLTGKYNMRINTLYSEGKWNMKNDSNLMLISGTSDTIPLRIVSFKKDTLSVYFQTGKSFTNYLNYLANDLVLTFISDTIRYLLKPNPYSFSYNQWAVKAKRKLNEKEIREKLLNYLDYLIVVLKDERDNSRYLDKITNPVCLAANGVSLIRKALVDPEWQNLFYDQEGFEKAFEILQNTFQCHITIKENTDFVDLDSDILRQLKLIIKRGRPCPCEF